MLFYLPSWGDFFVKHVFLKPNLINYNILNLMNLIDTHNLTIIAGPDSIDDYNLNEIYDIANIKIDGEFAITGTRTVGLKSRTSFDSQNSDKGFMGSDFENILEYQKNFVEDNTTDFDFLPSINMAKKIYEDTGLLCSTEIMLPHIQLPVIAKHFNNLPFLIWNPAVDQLGWHVRDMGLFAQKHSWIVGLKNPKWIGEDFEVSEHESFESLTSLEKAWEGLSDYSKDASQTIMIQRGVDVPRKGDYRNLPIHQSAKRIKMRSLKKDNNVQMFFDPSHALGDKLRHRIVDETIEAMKIRLDNSDEFLYDGILIEVGTAKCDTHQHITVTELEQMVRELANFRSIQSRVKSNVYQV